MVVVEVSVVVKTLVSKMTTLTSDNTTKNLFVGSTKLTSLKITVRKASTIPTSSITKSKTRVASTTKTTSKTLVMSSKLTTKTTNKVDTDRNRCRKTSTTPTVRSTTSAELPPNKSLTLNQQKVEATDPLPNNNTVNKFTSSRPTTKKTSLSLRRSTPMVIATSSIKKISIKKLSHPAQLI